MELVCTLDWLFGIHCTRNQVNVCVRDRDNAFIVGLMSLRVCFCLLEYLGVLFIWHVSILVRLLRRSNYRSFRVLCSQSIIGSPRCFLEMLLRGVISKVNNVAVNWNELVQGPYLFSSLNTFGAFKPYLI